MTKRILFLLMIAVVFAVGCQTDNTSDRGVALGNEASFTISLEPTRTSLGDKVGDTYSCYWSEGDRIVVNGECSDEAQIDAENGALATFRFANATLSGPYHLTYPYCASTTAERPVVLFLAEQNYTSNTFAEGSAPMCGYAEEAGEDIKLNHLAGVLHFSIKASAAGVVLDKVIVTATNHIAGEFDVDCRTATISATEHCESVVTYSLPADFVLSTSSASDLFIALPAVDIGACTIEFVESSGEKMVANWTPNQPLAQGVVREFDTITYKAKNVVSLQPLTTEDDQFEVFYKNLCGYVRYSDGSPIADVAVSDGFQVVTTDENGYYELNGVTLETWYIYCSLPADVEVPIDEYGRPCFFKKYVANTKRYDFEFEKLAGGKETKFALLALADTQVSNSSQVDRFRAQASPEIKNYSASLDFRCYGVALGDVIYSPATSNNEYLMPEMRQAFKECGVPVFAVFGNHDNAYFSTTSPLFPDERNNTFNLKIQRPFEECFGPIDYSFNRGDTHIVCMRNMQWNSNDNPSGTNLTEQFTDEQLAWLQQDLALVPKSKSVVLCVHIPIYNRAYKNLQEALTLLDEFAESHILSGHLHFRNFYAHKYKGTGHKAFEQIWSSAHGTGWGDGGNLNCDGAPNGYGVVVFENGFMRKSIHKGYPYGMNSEDYQIRLHRGGDITGAAIPEGATNSNGTMGYYQFPYDSSVILANVFSSDPWFWTIEVWEYDETTGERTTKLGNMTSLNSYNDTPIWEELIGSFTYDDPKRVAEGVESGRDFWTTGVICGYLGRHYNKRYHECHTMWKFTLPNPDAKVMVVAKDSWGNEFEQKDFQVGTDAGYAVYNPAYNPTVE